MDVVQDSLTAVPMDGPNVTSPQTVPIETSSISEIISIAIVSQSSYFLLIVLLSCFSWVSKARPLHRFIIETSVLFGPYLMSVTVLSSLSYFNCWIMSILAFVFLSRYQRVWVTPKWTEILFIPKPVKIRTQRLQTVSCLYFSLMSSTIICILAVDFEIFPRRFAKTDFYGYSLMDMGIGSFVALNGLLSHEARGSIQTVTSDTPKLLTSKTLHLVQLSSVSVMKTIKSSLPLLALGFGRTFFVSMLNYQNPVTEYGTHWNFFFTLASVKILSSLCYKYLPKAMTPVKFSLGLMILYQAVLSTTQLSEFIRSGDRNNIITSNREGIFSLFGFVPLYIISVEIGSYLFRKRNRNKSVDHLLAMIELWIISSFTFILMKLCDSFIETVSRRECNLSFVLWIISFYTFLLGLESGLQLVIDFFTAAGLLREELICTKVYLMEAISQNSLVIFLISNILTGLVNISIVTSHVNHFVAIIILISYVFVTCSVAYYFQRQKIIILKTSPQLVMKRLSQFLKKRR